MRTGCRAGSSGDGGRVVAMPAGALYLDPTRYGTFAAIVRQDQWMDASFEG